MGPLEKILRQSPAWVDKATRAMYKRMLGNTSFENQELMQQIQKLIDSGLSSKDSRITTLEKLQRPKGLQESNLFTAHMAGVQHMDPDAELLLAPLLNAEDKAAASMIFRPGYHTGEPGLDPNSIYIEGLASEVPGGGTQLLKQLESEYPGRAMHLESMSYPETMEFYTKKGFVEVPRKRGENLIGGTAPFFIKPAGVQLKAKGGPIKKAAKLAGGGLIKSAFYLAKAYPRITSEARLADYVASRLPSNLKSVGSLSRMASGTGRMPFALGDELVAKVARMPRGIMENSMEGDWVAPVPEAIWKSDDDAVSVVKRARPITAKQDPETMGLLNSLRTAIMNHGGRPGASPEMQEALDALGWDALLNYDPLWGDIAKRNIGVIENKPILLDAGILSKSILDPSAVSSTISPAEWAQYRREVLKSKNGYAQGGHVKPTYNTQNPMDHGLRNAELAQRIARAKSTGSSIKKGALSWAPDVAGFFLGDIPDAAAYVLRRAKNVQGEQSIPSLGAGAAVRRAVHDLQSQLGLEDKFVHPAGQSVGPVYEPSITEEVAQFANPLAFVNPGTAVRGAGRGAAELIARAAQSEGPLARMATAGFRPMNVVKNKGGNWLSGSVEDALSNVKRGAHFGPGPAEIIPGSPTEAINSWIDKALTKYVKNQMATPEDPIRALAEQGVLHYEPPRNLSLIGFARANRKDAGMRPQATTHLGGSWEDAADAALRPITAGQYQKQVGPNWKANPWMDKLAPEVPVYSMPRGMRELDNLGFPHLIDELSNAINPESGLPRHLQFPADRLSKVSVPQAVQRVSDINKWRAEQKAIADAALANNAATVLHKEYPEKGMKWVELKAPELDDTRKQALKEQAIKEGLLEGSPELEGFIPSRHALESRQALTNALKYEGDVMGNCVGGYCDDVASGWSRIFSLRDAKGEPHVTIETSPQGAVFSDVVKYIGEEEANKLLDQGVTLGEMIQNIPNFERRQRIVQIKGKQNRPPNPEYLPFVQDFVRSGQWSDVGDLQNTGLSRLSERLTPEEVTRYREKLGDLPEWVTQGDIDSLVEQFHGKNFAQGGSVPSKIETVGQLRSIITALSKEPAHG